MKVSTNKLHTFSDDKFRATRPLDYIYDPLFTFSGPKDYYRTAHEAYQTSSEFSVQPIFDSMFSDMARYPRATLVLRPAHQVPQSIDTSYKGKVKATSQERTVTAEVTGIDRYKYFRRPVTDVQTKPPGTSSRPLLGLENVTTLGITAPPTTAQKLRERSARLSAATQARSVQTDYRESEAQTQPWTPPYVTRGNITPEVLHLDQLKWGNGLPPGKHEVELVEHLRRKQAWEGQLPPLDTEANIQKRFKLIACMEKSDWAFREKEVEAIHEQRMKKSEQLLEQHILLNRTRLGYRMEFLEDDINKRKERKLQLIRHDKERALRKLCMKEKGYNPKRHKMNIVAQHSQHTSEVYAPMKRNGISFKNRHEVLAEKHITIDSRDLSALENSVEYRPVFDYNKASQPKKQTELCVRETRWTMENLAKLHQDLQTLHAREYKKIDSFYTQAVEQIPRPSKAPDIPAVPLTQESKERLYQAAIMIQRVIHGRAKQTQMYEERNRWKEVMKELKSTEAMTSRQLDLLHQQKENQNAEARMLGVMENIIGLNVGMTIGQTLDLLAKELLRLKNEGIAHGQALQAECARWKREVPEAGRRQKETKRREEHNLMFSQLLDLYQDSINEFVETLVTRAREDEAKVQAFEHAKEVALLAELEQAIEEEPEEEEPISADLLFELVAPEGLRQLARTCMLVLRQKYVESRQRLVASGQAEPLPAPPLPQSSPSLDRLITLLSEPTSFFTYSYSEEDMSSTSQMDSQSDVEEAVPPVARFGLVTPATPEERLLARVMRDMCYIAGSLLHTAAKILNKALQLSNIPRESFEEALRRTMLVINGAREEIARLILPSRRSEAEPKLVPSDAIITEATQIVDGILAKAKERIEEVRTKQLLNMAASGVHWTVPRIVVESDIQTKAKELVEGVVKEAQLTVIQAIVEDFLKDLLKEAQEKVDIITEISKV